MLNACLVKPAIMLRYMVVALFQAASVYMSLQVRNLELEQCGNGDYPVVVSNVSVQLGKPLKISGSLSSDVDLVGPIKATIEIKRSVWGWWIEMPCEDNMGSCTYDDLCHYGHPLNETCGDVFRKNNVPCRCPIPKGNYTISPTVVEWRQFGSILSGKYKGTVTVTQNNTVLSCYSVKFVLYSQNYEKKSVILLV